MKNTLALQKVAKKPSQRIAYVSADVSTFAGAKAAFEASTSGASAAAASLSSSSSEPVGRIPDAVFCSAGGAKPGFFIEQNEQDFEQGIKTVYMTALCTAHVSLDALARWSRSVGELTSIRFPYTGRC